MRASGFLWRLTSFLLILSMVLPWTAMAATWTDEPDYSPGSVVTISGDNSDGAGYLPGETVQVAVLGPNGYAADCVGLADEAGTWSCQVTLWDSDLAVGEYSYTATGLDSGVVEVGEFTDGNIKVYPAPATLSFTLSYQKYSEPGCVNPQGAPGSGLVNSSGLGLGVPNGGSIRLTAPESVGSLEFERWSGAITSDSSSVCVGDAGGTRSVTAEYGSACTPPSISAQPANQTVTYGVASVDFSASASGSPEPTVQWQVSTNDGGSWAAVNAATGTTLTVLSPTAALSGNQYRAVFTNDCGGTMTATTDVAVLTVSKADAVCSVTGWTGEYDGDAHGASGSCAGIGGEAAGTLVLGASFTDVPGGTANWAFTGNGNYKNQSGSVEIVISEADPDCTIDGWTGTYDRDPHGATGWCLGVKGETLAGLVLGASFTDYPGGTANWAFTDVTGNYNDDSGSVAIVISEADPACTVTGYTGAYDGDPHGATGSCLGVKDETLAGLVLGNSFTNVPGGTANWTFTDETGNYNDDSGSVEIVINKAVPICDITGWTGTYDGVAHGASGSCVGVKEETLSGLDLGASFTNVPGGAANWTFTDVTGNYNDDSGSVAIVISEADAACTVTGYTGVYDGDPHGATGSCLGVKSEPLVGLDLGDSFTDVPGGMANWTFTDVTGNYNDDSGSVAIVISEADADCTISGYTGVYDGDPHGATGSCLGVKDETLAGLVLGSSFTNVPGGTANWTFTDVTGNYNDASGSASIVISMADPLCTVTGYSVVYDHSAHTATGSCVGVEDETLAGLDLTGTTHSEPGDYPGDEWTFTDVTGNYNDNSGTVHDDIHYATGGMCYGAPGHTILQPINSDGSSVFKQKSTVPAKFRVCDVNGVSIGTAGVVSSFHLVGIANGTVVDGLTEAVVSTTPFGEFRWSADEQQWIFNMNTKNLKAGMTYSYLINLNDGSTISFSFGLK
ncbi:MAG: PxKF domain-containing protein [Anaerolineae bacterium]